MVATHLLDKMFFERSIYKKYEVKNAYGIILNLRERGRIWLELCPPYFNEPAFLTKAALKDEYVTKIA